MRVHGLRIIAKESGAKKEKRDPATSDSINYGLFPEVNMKRFFFGSVVLVLSGATALLGQSPVPKASSAEGPAAQKNAVAKDSTVSAQAKIDPAKEADIRRLLELAGTKALVIQTMASMTDSIKPVLTNSLPPGDYRAKLVDLFCEKFVAKADAQHLLDLAIPSYDKNFTHEEIRGLIQFYQTPLGQKSISVIPKLVKETQEEGRKWGEDLGRQSMMEVLAEHPELAQAMTDAQKSPPPGK